MSYSHEDALTMIRHHSKPLVQRQIQILSLKRANGRIAAKSYRARYAIPKYDNAAVDGYAVNTKDLTRNRETRLPIVAKIAAGDPIRTLKPDTTAHILTGAPVPENADAVIMQEDVSVEKNTAVFPENVKPNSNIRAVGEDFQKNQTVIKKGQKIKPQDLAALAANGIIHVECTKPLKIILFSSGNEITRNKQSKKNTTLFDANYPMLHSLLQETLNITPKDGGIIKDHPQKTREILEKAAQNYDAVITTGGASDSQEDHIRRTLRDHGTIHVNKIKVKPGRPFIFAHLKQTPLFALPGNPVAVMVCFLIYTLPALRVMQGHLWQDPQIYRIKADFDIKHKKSGRREFWRACVTNHLLRKYPRDGSGLISSIQSAQGLIDVREDIISVKKGDALPFIPFSQFGI